MAHSQPLAQGLIRLFESAGRQVYGVFQFDMSRRTKAANAALIGLGNTRRIILGDTLLKEFTPDEIETILAHELAHHVHKDLPMGILVEGAITVVGLYLASLVLNLGITTLGFESVADIAALPNVASIRPLVNYEIDLSETVPYIGAAAVQAAGVDGTGVRVAVLDSGIDYTHYNLGKFQAR